MNCPVDVSKIVSMIIQDLRQFNYGALIDIVKKAEYSLDFVDHDNWDGGIDYFKLRFHLKYADFAKILSAQKNYEEILTKSLNSFYKDERFVITGIELVAKIDQYVDWAAVAPQHNKESVLRLIKEEKGTLIKAGTGIIQIRDKKENDSYKQRHQQLLSLLKQLGLEPVHRYNDLWDWYNDYKQRGLDTYQSRRAFIRDIYAPLIDTLENSEENTTTLLYYEPTGWDLVDDGANRMKEVLISAEKTLDYQSVGMYGRELLITLAQAVFDKAKHPSTDGTDIGAADSKRMLDAYIHYCMHKKSKEREVKFAKAAVDFSNELTHNRTATAMDAELCYNAVLSTVHIIRTLHKYND